MAANQAVEVAEADAKVIETRTIQQGLAAMLGYMEDLSLDENIEAMTEEVEYVVSGQITNAIRDTEINGVTIKKDDYMGIVDGDIKLSESDLYTALENTIKEMISSDSEIITIIHGEGIDDNTAEETIEKLSETFDDIEIESHKGDQPVYPYLISVE